MWTSGLRLSEQKDSVEVAEKDRNGGGHKEKVNGRLQRDDVQSGGGGVGGGNFLDARGVRQRCSLTSKLFSLLIADLDDRMERGGKGERVGVRSCMY